MVLVAVALGILGTAPAEATTYNFTYSIDPGSDYGSSQIAGTASYSGNHTASVNVVIAKGYAIYDIKLNGTSMFNSTKITNNSDGSSSYTDAYTASVTDNTVVAYIKPTTVTVNAVVASGAPSGAGISPTSKTINYNTTTTFTVNPITNYIVSFSGSYGCGSGTFASNTYTTGNITGTCTVTATYVRVYTISAQTDGSSGSSVSPTSVQIPTTGSQTFTASTTNACYTFNNFTEGGNVLTTGGNYTVSGNSVTVANPTSDHTVQANFSQNHYAVTENTSAGTSGCSATFNNTPASFSSIACGTSGTFTVTPSTGCQVNSVTQSTGCGLTGPTGGAYSVTPTQNCTVTANLGVQTFTVSSALGAGAPTGASISATKTNVAYNSTVSFTSPVVSGYTVTFTGTAGGCDAGTTSGPTSGNYTYTTGKITGACTVTALYSHGTNTVTINQVGGTGTVTCCGSGCTNTWPDSGIASYTITPPNGQVLSSVSLSPGTFTTNNSSSTGAACGAITFPMNSANQTLTVNWGHGTTVTQTTYTNGVADNPAGSGGGTISACPAGSSSDTWPDNATAQYAITPASGYALTTVSAGPTGGPYTSMLNPSAGGYTCASPYTFSVGTSAQSLTAYFASALTVTPRIWTNGVFTPTGGTVTSCNGSNTWGQNTTASYAVTPASGYTVQWLGVNPSTSYTPLNPGGYSCTGVSYQFPMGSSNQTLVVSFIPANSVRIVGSTVGGGDITVGAYNGQSIVSTSFNAGFNTSQTFYFIPPSGKGISSVSFDGNVVTGSVACPNGDFTVSGNSNTNACTYTVPNVGTTGHTLSVTYDTVYQVTVNTSTSGCNQSSGGGFIGTSAPGVTQQVINVVNGKPVSFTVSPNSGFVVNGLDFGGVAEISTPQFTSYTFTSPPIRANVTAMATFTPFYTISSQIVSATGTTATGTVTPPTAQVVCGNSSPTFTFTPTAPASISDVSVTVGSNGAQSQGVISSYTFSNVTSNASVTVTFTQEVFQLSNYSIIPPFVQSPVLPNLLLMIDNSASQYDLQYDSTGQCYDNNAYNDTVTYYGYFSKDTYYSYNTASGRFEAIPAGDTMPSSCTFRTPFFCVQMSGGAGATPVSQGGTRTIASVTLGDGTVVNGFIARGNFVNYLVTSKFDLQKMILTGGKFDVPSNSLVAESRGCMGKRFVKVLSSTQGQNTLESVANITFVVRGPNASDPDYVNPVVQNGTSRIDIYDGAYNITACTSAFTNSSSVDTCLAAPVGGTNLKANSVIHALHVCIKGSGNGNMNSLEMDCNSDWTTNYGSNPSIASTLIVNDQGGDAICSSVIKHPLINGRDTGYLGFCCNPGVTDCSKSRNWDATCEANQMADFCGQMQSQQVVDPSGTTSTTGSNYLPSFVIDAGVDALGPAVADYLAKAYQQQAPTGLIQEFQNYIGFGVLAFNYDGAGSECNDGVTNTSSPIPCTKVCSDTGKACYINSDCASNSCNVIVKTDGGKIPAGGYIGDPIGDHSTGLINVIDNLQGTSWTPFAETFYEGLAYLINSTNTSLADTKPTRLQTNDFDATRQPPSASCYLNNVLIITDGASTADQNAHVNTLATNSTLNPTGSRYASFCSNFKGSTNVAALASMAYNRNIWDLTKAADHSINNEYVTTYVTYSGPDSTSTSACDPKNLMLNTANYGSGGKIPMYWASDYPSMVSNMRDAFKKIATSSASGTAASILNNSQGSGANLLQAVFFPKKIYTWKDSNNQEQQDVASWIGELQNLWFYVDPYLGNSTVREDTNQDYKLSLTQDYVVNFGYTQNQATVTLLQDVLGNGSSLLTQSSNASLDTLNSLWKAGRKLWDRNLTTDPRQIFTLIGTANTDGVVVGSGVDSVNGKAFSRFISGGTFTNDATVQKYLQVSSQGDANTLVDYISGIDQTNYRSRKVTIPGCLWTDAEGCKREWKLGDIVSSTPKLDSNLALNTYAASWPQGFNDSSYALFTGSQNYLNRGMVFVGGNDGMLHAFRLGVLDVSNQFTATGAIDNDKKARMLYNGSLATYPSGGSLGSDLGREEWAYIPMNALPYLRYLGDPNYIHIYYVDNTVSLFDASIGVSSTSSSTCSSTNYEQCQKMTTLDGSGNLDMDKTSWRTVLIGGMGLGGASRDQTATCTDNVATGTCVKTPVSGIGYSSYFALDVTNPAIPPGSSDPGAVKPLWEFNAGGELGYSLTGPAVVRIGVAGDTRATKNGKWFAVFGSGPTGPIESTTHTFYGKSDQNLTLFVVDIGTGQLAGKIVTNVPYAFAGTLTTAVIDTDRNYSDDAFYVGYVQADSTQTNWNKGGVLRVLTHQDPNPSHWTVSDLVTGIGPVTTSVTKLQDTAARWGANGTGAVGKLWLYFGSGRFFYKNDMASVSEPFRIYGVTDPCYSAHTAGPDFTPTGPSNAFLSTCTASVDLSTLQNQTGDASTAPASTLGSTKTGWYVNLATTENVVQNNSTITYNAERVITNPNANTNGTVFFSTLMPTADPCGVGGQTYIWAFKYDTGAQPLAATMKGSILLQVSTGDLKQIQLATAFQNPTNQGYNMRRLASPISGVPPTGSGMVGMNRPGPTKKLLHMQEK
ncbi:hypothetical protein GMSM_21800 [Geomonas sp. Red276]